MVLIILICLLVTILAFTSEKNVYKYFAYLKHLFTYETKIQKGERLSEWMGRYSLTSVGFDLDRELPDISIYKSYGNELHFLWEQVRVYGGGLSPCMKSLRKTLRLDLKFEKSKDDALYGAYVQIAVMLALSWSYFLSFIFLDITKLSPELLISIILWQLFGAILFIFLINKLEKKTFAASHFFLRSINKLTIVLKGGLALSHLEISDYLGKLNKNEDILHGKVSSLIYKWREHGSVNSEGLGELEEEYWFCLEQKIDKFLSVMTKSSFVWSILFVLPCLFIVTFFSFGEMLLTTGQ
jgi:hypothetical protein